MWLPMTGVTGYARHTRTVREVGCASPTRRFREGTPPSAFSFVVLRADAGRACAVEPCGFFAVRTGPSPQEFAQHLSIARGSLAEVDILLLVGERLKYWTTPAEIHHQLLEVRRLLQGLLSRLRPS